MRPTLLMGCGLMPASVTPLMRLVERCAKKMCTSALCVSRAAAAAKHWPSCGQHKQHGGGWSLGGVYGGGWSLGGVYGGGWSLDGVSGGMVGSTKWIGYHLLCGRNQGLQHACLTGRWQGTVCEALCMSS